MNLIHWLNFRKTGQFIASNRDIVIITPGFASDEQDTSCIPALQLYVKELQMRGNKVTVFALHYPFKKENYNWHGARVIPLNGKNNRLKRELLLPLRLMRCFSKVHKETPVDLIHSFWLNESTIMAQRIAKKYEIPIVASAQGQDALPSNRHLARIKKLTIPVVGMSKIQTEYLLKNGLNQSQTITWGIQPIEMLPKKWDLICVGNLIPIKKQNYFIELCKNLKMQGVSFRAQIVGSGPEEQSLLEQIKRNSLDHEVRLVGQLSYEETLMTISQTKVLIHPSQYEGFGMVLIEALASGTHVLSSPVGFSAHSKDVTHLTFDLDKDTKELKRLLHLDVPDPIVYHINDTVDKYEEIYTNL